MADREQSVIVLLGAGIQDDAWAPIIKALRRTHYPRVFTDDAANAALANLVYNRRFWCMQRDRSDDAGTAETCNAFQSMYEEVRAAIAEELKAAEDRAEIALRDTFERVWNTHVLGTGQLAIVTTNWDRVLTTEASREWSSVDENSVFHLHGDRRDPGFLLLPTEVVFEPYREQKHVYVLGKRTHAIMKALETAERLVISGLALSPLDAELAHILAIGIDEGRVSDICIADPEHERVAGRLMTLVRKREPRVYGCDPRTPKATKEYPWRGRVRTRGPDPGL